MKKIMLINGSPRKTMNTAAMLNSFAEGIKSVSDEIEVRQVNLYEYQFHGCYSCMGCKLKDKKVEHCVIKDGIYDILKETAYADGICFGTPIYYMDITGQLRCFIERLIFPWLNYKLGKSFPPKHVPTAFIYTMNAPKEYAPMLEQMYNMAEIGIAISLSKPERIPMYNTVQVKDYSRYEFSQEMADAKVKYQAEHYTEEMKNAYEAGRRMAEKVLSGEEMKPMQFGGMEG